MVAGTDQRMQVDPMLTNSLATNLVSPIPPRPLRSPSRTGVVLSTSRQNVDNRPLRACDVQIAELTGLSAVDPVEPRVEISPAEIVRRSLLAWDGIAGEVIQATQRERIAFRYQGPLHLLAVYDQGARSDGDTFVQGLPRSSLRDLKRKLTFVPAGYEYRESHEPRTFARVIYYYFNPSMFPVDPQVGRAQPSPRLHFEDATLLDTAIKLAAVIESAGAHNRIYVEALGTVLAYELARHDSASRVQEPARGGLAAWQQKAVAAYIEEHLAEPISLGVLAQLARLSPFYFCRAFKQSFGIPPHRYHTNRRMERAKALLAGPEASVTEVGIKVGFSETRSFTAAFRKATGLTPTRFWRSLT
jgi:AraC family transcriptional regulator